MKKKFIILIFLLNSWSFGQQIPDILISSSGYQKDNLVLIHDNFYIKKQYQIKKKINRKSILFPTIKVKSDKYYSFRKNYKVKIKSNQIDITNVKVKYTLFYGEFDKLLIKKINNQKMLGVSLVVKGDLYSSLLVENTIILIQDAYKFVDSMEIANSSKKVIIESPFFNYENYSFPSQKMKFAPKLRAITIVLSQGLITFYPNGTFIVIKYEILKIKNNNVRLSDIDKNIFTSNLSIFLDLYGSKILVNDEFVFVGNDYHKISITDSIIIAPVSSNSRTKKLINLAGASFLTCSYIIVY